ncbi:hypothetical protein [Paenibacillus sp. FSL H8-0034]|uniref:hypothetical protein n=1 Tax=Paenibacillus sp. FSL H8-0034 TaxID=2954671 RepID=UPI0030F697B8
MRQQPYIILLLLLVIIISGCQQTSNISENPSSTTSTIPSDPKLSTVAPLSQEDVQYANDSWFLYKTMALNTLPNTQITVVLTRTQDYSSHVKLVLFQYDGSKQRWFPAWESPAYSTLYAEPGLLPKGDILLDFIALQPKDSQHMALVTANIMIGGVSDPSSKVIILSVDNTNKVAVKKSLNDGIMRIEENDGKIKIVGSNTLLQIFLEKDELMEQTLPSYISTIANKKEIHFQLDKKSVTGVSVLEGATVSITAGETIWLVPQNNETQKAFSDKEIQIYMDTWSLGNLKSINSNSLKTDYYTFKEPGKFRFLIINKALREDTAPTLTVVVKPASISANSSVAACQKVLEDRGQFSEQKGTVDYKSGMRIFPLLNFLMTKNSIQASDPEQSVYMNDNPIFITRNDKYGDSLLFATIHSKRTGVLQGIKGFPDNKVNEYYEPMVLGRKTAYVKEVPSTKIGPQNKLIEVNRQTWMKELAEYTKPCDDALVLPPIQTKLPFFKNMNAIYPFSKEIDFVAGVEAVGYGLSDYGNYYPDTNKIQIPVLLYCPKCKVENVVMLQNNAKLEFTPDKYYSDWQEWLGQDWHLFTSEKIDFDKKLFQKADLANIRSSLPPFISDSPSTIQVTINGEKVIYVNQ